jgi:hypothetical protein
MWDGTIAGELPPGATEEEIMFMATGHTNGNRNNEKVPSGAPSSAPSRREL